MLRLITGPLRRGVSDARALCSVAAAADTTTASSKQTHGFDLDIHGRVATVALDSGPANLLSFDTLSSLRTTLAELKDPSQGVDTLVITAKSPGIFSAGLDMKELYQPQEDRLAQYWEHIQGCMGELYSSPLHTISRINGHAIAGGLIVAMATDYRVMMSEDAKGKPCRTGLTEAMIGMTMPWWMQRLTVLTAGPRTAERCMALSPLMEAEVARTMGFVDDVAAGEEDLDRLVQKELDTVAKVPFGGRSGNKLQVGA
mmetsp:Transcript_11584/g.33487  ORF Transcript_11584/g.33487 Transcript_11584/m.33487 type:complete len:257 (-) Transcript_11584:489-1259(-)